MSVTAVCPLAAVAVADAIAVKPAARVLVGVARQTAAIVVHGCATPRVAAALMCGARFPL
jgi:hypothetical protein